MTTPPTSHQFVPFVAAVPSTEKREFQITVISQTDQPPGMQSLEKAVPGMTEKTLTKKNCEPNVSLQKDNGRITGVLVQCSCGQTLDLSFVYEASRRSESSKQDDPTKQNELPGNWPAKPPQPEKPEKPAKSKK
jgi:hypothetical protein